MADDFGNVTVTPPVAPVRDARRLKRIVVTMDEATGKRIESIEIGYTSFSTTDEKTDANPDGVLNQDGANFYKKSANVDATKVALFKAGAKAEIEARLAEDNIDA
ncbi:hypothetical protein LCGC14_0836200 [marine sediment metagenome]|uniref:Uncharacterized protein n=1 Tax=marine sediment metagenome TaxID=412755 RepID=A0A0F9PJ31_9ZZZZ